jgi:hypothetical protein
LRNRRLHQVVLSLLERTRLNQPDNPTKIEPTTPDYCFN